MVLSIFFPDGSDIVFSIIYGIYRLFVANIYNIFVDVAKTPVTDTYRFVGVLNTIYILGSIFMLFRITITMIQMILNPDLAATDKNGVSGTSSLVKRVVVVLLLLMLLYPENGLILGRTGLLSKFENAFISDGGLITKLTTINSTNSSCGVDENGIANFGPAAVGVHAGDANASERNYNSENGTTNNNSNNNNSSSCTWIYSSVGTTSVVISTDGDCDCPSGFKRLQSGTDGKKVCSQDITSNPSGLSFNKPSDLSCPISNGYGQTTDGKCLKCNEGYTFDNQKTCKKDITNNDNNGPNLISYIRPRFSFIDNVYAATQLDCYYYSVLPQCVSGNFGDNTPSIEDRVFHTSGNVIHITFYDYIKEGAVKIDHPWSLNGDKYSYIAHAEPLNTKPEFSYVSIGNKRQIEATDAYFKNSFPSQCPPVLKERLINTTLKAEDKLDIEYDSVQGCWQVVRGGYVGGYRTEAQLLNAIDEEISSGRLTSNLYDPDSDKTTIISTTEQEYKGTTTFNPGIVFATNVAKSFMACAEDADFETCDNAANNAFASGAGADQFKKELNKDHIQMDFLTSIIAGLAVAVFLIFLIVDIIIRKFKLLLLEIISPIAIIGYIDSKNNMFSEWGKMYIATYIDIFIKLIALNFALRLFPIVWHSIGCADGLLLKFFYIIAILIFAKWIPTMISKIFGIDVAGGSFKEIGGMLKKGMGAIGGTGILAASAWMDAKSRGQSVGKQITSALSGGLKGGIAGGRSGKLSDIKAANRTMLDKAEERAQQDAQGLSLMERMAIAIENKTGMPATGLGQRAEEQITGATDMANQADSLKTDGDKGAKKKNARYMAFSATKHSDGVVQFTDGLRDENGNLIVTNGDIVDISDERRKAYKLNRMTEDQWNSKSEDEKAAYVGEQAWAAMGNSDISLKDAAEFMNKRVELSLANSNNTNAKKFISSDEKVNARKESNVLRFLNDENGFNEMSIEQKIDILGNDVVAQIGENGSLADAWSVMTEDAKMKLIGKTSYNLISDTSNLDTVRNELQGVVNMRSRFSTGIMSKDGMFEVIRNGEPISATDEDVIYQAVVEKTSANDWNNMSPSDQEKLVGPRIYELLQEMAVDPDNITKLEVDRFLRARAAVLEDLNSVEYIAQFAKDDPSYMRKIEAYNDKVYDARRLGVDVPEAQIIDINDRSTYDDDMLGDAKKKGNEKASEIAKENEKHLTMKRYVKK